MTTAAKSQSFATGASIVAIICASVSVLTFTIAVSQIFMGHTPSVSAYAVMVCTLPVTIVCTIIACVLVGPRQCKLAWIAIGLFALQFISGYTIQYILMHR